MHKVIVERPRRNSGYGKQGRRANLSYDLLPKFEGIKRLHGGHKSQRDLFGPLRRWLQSRVDRPWNDVYSEACTVIHPDDYVRVHVKTHLFEFVERHTFMHKGQVCVIDTDYLHKGVIPVSEIYRRRGHFFVHPETGLLQVFPKISKRARQSQNPKPPATIHWIAENLALKQIRGLWFECRYEEVTVESWFKVHDHALERMIISGKNLPWHQHSYGLCIHKRQLSKRELRRWGLRNTPAPVSTGAQSSTGFSRCRWNTVLRLFIGLPCYRVPDRVLKNESYYSFLHGLGCGQCRAFTE